MESRINPDKIKSCDIVLLTSDNGIFDRIIETATRSDKVHVAISVGGYWVAEYTMKSGGRLYDLRSYERKGRGIIIKRDNSLTLKQRDSIKKWAMDNLWYGYEGFWQFALYPFKFLSVFTPEKIKCSEFLHNCFMKGAGINYFERFAGLSLEKIAPSHWDSLKQFSPVDYSK